MAGTTTTTGRRGPGRPPKSPAAAAAAKEAAQSVAQPVAAPSTETPSPQPGWARAVRRFHVEIEGLRPGMMQHRCPAGLEDKLAKGNRTTPGSRGEAASPDAIAEAACYRDSGSKIIYLPKEHLMGSLISAGRQFSLSGNMKLSTGAGTRIYGYIQINAVEADYPLEDDTVDGFPLYRQGPTGREYIRQFLADQRFATNQVTKAKVLAVRPLIPGGWRAEFVLTLMNEFSPEGARLLIDSALIQNGVGAYRPANGGPYGQAKVTRWDEIL